MYDMIIRNGSIIDGTGSPAYRCDIAVKDGKIVRMARSITASAAEVIEAEGLTVTPGFIDSHSHSDNAVFTHPDMKEKVEQGITTSVGGQCGSTLAPVYKGITAENAADVGDFGKEHELCKTFGTMMKVAKDIPLGSNLISFVGHSALRKAVIGMDNRKATADELEHMKSLLREAMDNGAIGVSFGLIYTPSCYSDTEELIALAKVVKEYEGVISAHIRDEGFRLAAAVAEFIEVVKATDVKGVISHHKAIYEENWGKVSHTLRMIDEAVDEGYDIYCDVYPYNASQTGLVPTIVPKEFRAKDSKGIVEMLSDPDMCEKIKDAHSAIYGDNLDNLQITYCNGHPEYEGMRISKIAEQRGQGHFEAAFDLIRMSGAGVGVCKFNMCEEDIETVIAHERAMICTDSSVDKGHVHHPRLRGTFPRAIGKYVRERHIVSLPEMIRKCTSMPASVYGLASKGILREGFDADICIFDADKFVDKCTYTDCRQRCEGLNYVIIGGEIAAANAIHNGKRNGRFILRVK